MRNRQPRMYDSATRHRHSTRRPTIDELKAAMVSRWPDAFHDAAGVSPESLDGRGHSCPRCGGNDRFAAFKDVAERGSVQCRICFNSATDPKPGDGIATLRWLLACDTVTACRWLADWLGWSRSVHRPDPPPLRRFVRLEQATANDGEMGAIATRCHEALPQAWWPKLEAQLSLPAAELIRLRVGWSKEHKATTWPMVDHDDNVVGIRLRCLKTGKKWSVPGGLAGLFVPSELPTSIDRLFIAEGPTDCAALSSFGFVCIGRPSCNGAVSITTKLVHRLHPAEVVVVADDDANQAGKRGAESLAVALVTVCPRVRIIYPPSGSKDAREWIRHGATAGDVLGVVDAAGVKSLSMKTGVTR